jgi:hypothetical protein
MGAMPSGSYWRVLAVGGLAGFGEGNVEADVRSSLAGGGCRPEGDAHND